MQPIIDFIVGAMMAYIAFTNFLAGEILEIVAPETIEEETIELEEEMDEMEFSNLPSEYMAVIPTILRESASYQQAAVLGSSDEPIIGTAEDPIDALVNIYCTFITPTHIRTTTGTGFFVNDNGVILTNAHVAQFLLLEKTDALGDAECTIRTGNPASPRYKAELLYIPPAWVQEHASLIDDAAPTGTGERDYALLHVVEGIENTPLPASFPSLTTNTELLSRNTKGRDVTAAGYPAESLLNDDITSELVPRSAPTIVTELYTFGSNYADVISLQGSTIGEHGSSGGPVLSDDGEVIGIITTRGDDELDGQGSLRAITLSHIHRTILEETGFSFARNVSGDVETRAQVFGETMAPFLTQLLATEIEAD